MVLSPTQRRVREKSTALYTATIQDENGTALTAAALTTLTLTLYDKTTGDIINSRDGQDILNAHNVTLDGEGLLSWMMTPEDNVIVTPTSYLAGQFEQHVALFQWTWASGTKAGKYVLLVDVEQLEKVA